MWKECFKRGSNVEEARNAEEEDKKLPRKRLQWIRSIKQYKNIGKQKRGIFVFVFRQKRMDCVCSGKGFVMMRNMIDFLWEFTDNCAPDTLKMDSGLNGGAEKELCEVKPRLALEQI